MKMRWSLVCQFYMHVFVYLKACSIQRTKYQLESGKLDQKHTVRQPKIEIQKEFKNKLGLIVDLPKPGFGNTNDGNTSQFFLNRELAAKITGISIKLIYRLSYFGNIVQQV